MRSIDSFLHAFNRSSGTFRIELAATLFLCLYLSTHMPLIVEQWRDMAIPLTLIALCYPLKILLMAWLVRQGGTSWDFGHSPRLVTGGPYRLTRNPVYMVALAQFALWFAVVSYCEIGVDNSEALPAALWITGAGLTLLGAWSYFDRVAVPREERRLAEDHGEAFVAYCARVPRWGATEGANGAFAFNATESA